MSTNFENCIFIFADANGTFNTGIFGSKKYSGYVIFTIIDYKTDKYLGTAYFETEITNYNDKSIIFSIYSNKEEILRTIFNTDDMEVDGYNRFINDIAVATNKTTADVEKIIADAYEALRFEWHC